MNLIEIFLIPFAIFIGIITSYEDYKEGRIKNKWIIISLLYSLAVLLIAVTYLFSKGETLNQVYIYDYFLNIFFALFAGLIIWYGGLWSAGDAKLFTAYAALVPLSIYQLGYIQHFPAFIILVNTFFPLFIYYFFKIMLKTTLKEKAAVIKGMLNPKFLLNSVLFIFAFVWIIKLGLGFSNEYTTLANNIFVTIALLFIILFIFNNFLKVDLLAISIIISVIEIIFDYKNIFTINYLSYFLIILFLFIFLRYFVINLGHGFFSKSVYIEDLKPGMIPAENIIKKKGKYTKKKIVPISFIAGLVGSSEKNRMFHLVSEGLTKEEIKKIQTLHSSGHIKDHSIRISHVVPFAPFMFFGVLITILCKGNLFFYLMFVLERFI